MSNENFKKALFDALTSDYENSIPTIEEHIFSPKFEKQMKRLINRRNKPYYRIINTVGKRVACIAIVILIISSVTVMSVEALRNAVADFFVRMYEKFSTVQSVDDDDVSPKTIEDIYEITYDLSEFIIDYDYLDDYSRYITYIKDDFVIYYEQYTKEMYDKNVNTEDAEISTLLINGHEAVYFQDNHQNYNLIWDNDDYIISIGTNISKDALIEIAESVQIVED